MSDRGDRRELLAGMRPDFAYLVSKSANFGAMVNYSPIGRSVEEASAERARRDPEYRAELERLRPYEQIARQVIRLRMDHGLSQEALAARVGTTKSAISRLESGQHAPNVATLQKIAAALGSRLVVSFESVTPPNPPAAKREQAAVA